MPRGARVEKRMVFIEHVYILCFGLLCGLSFLMHISYLNIYGRCAYMSASEKERANVFFNHMPSIMLLVISVCYLVDFTFMWNHGNTFDKVSHIFLAFLVLIGGVVQWLLRLFYINHFMKKTRYFNEENEIHMCLTNYINITISWVPFDIYLLGFIVYMFIIILASVVFMRVKQRPITD